MLRKITKYIQNIGKQDQSSRWKETIVQRCFVEYERRLRVVSVNHTLFMLQLDFEAQLTLQCLLELKQMRQLN